MNTSQLVLIDNEGARSGAWRLDEHTREVGRRGVAEARRALAEAHATDEHTTEPERGDHTSTAA
jgi:hypothetical protein